MAKTVLTIDSFFDRADQLRGEFESRFNDPRSTSGDRFVWDYWHVPGQYTTLRTPAYHFFSQRLYERFHNELAWWGRRVLGCHDISPPWMSCYIDGCKQELHGDLPHGPWAFVYSLTPWKNRRFRGGETILLREEILRYWQGFQSTRGLEEKDVLQDVPALFNRLTVFDPRIPHGVREVEGVRDLLEGRLVIHGWFVQPRPFVEGAMPVAALQSAIDDLTGELNRFFASGADVFGVFSARFQVTRAGTVSDFKVLSNALRSAGGDPSDVRRLVRMIREFLSKAQFGKQRGVSHVTLPLIFEVG